MELRGTCWYCGKEFVSEIKGNNKNYAIRKYCSKECEKAFKRRVPKMPRVQVCARCDMEFTAYGPGKFCERCSPNNNIYEIELKKVGCLICKSNKDIQLHHVRGKKIDAFVVPLCKAHHKLIHSGHSFKSLLREVKSK